MQAQTRLVIVDVDLLIRPREEMGDEKKSAFLRSLQMLVNETGNLVFLLSSETPEHLLVLSFLLFFPCCTSSKSTKTDAEGAAGVVGRARGALAGEDRTGRCSDSLLYWYNSTNTDAAGSGGRVLLQMAGLAG